VQTITIAKDVHLMIYLSVNWLIAVACDIAVNGWVYVEAEERSLHIYRVTNCISDLNEQMIINSTAPFLFCAVAKIAKKNDSLRN